MIHCEKIAYKIEKGLNSLNIFTVCIYLFIYLLKIIASYILQANSNMVMCWLKCLLKGDITLF